MKRALAVGGAAALFLLAAPTTCFAQESPPWFIGPPKPKGPPHRVWTWDLDLEGGLGSSFADEGGGFSGFGRIRGGALSLDANDLSAPMLSLGFFADGSTLATEVAYGLQGEIALNHLGLWGQLGLGVDVAPRPMATAAVGWALFGLEAQGRFEPESGDFYPALFGKLRIPIGIAAAAVRYR